MATQTSALFGAAMASQAVWAARADGYPWRVSADELNLVRAEILRRERELIPPARTSPRVDQFLHWPKKIERQSAAVDCVASPAASA